MKSCLIQLKYADSIGDQKLLQCSISPGYHRFPLNVNNTEAELNIYSSIYLLT